MFPSFVLFAALIACSKATTGLGGPCSSSKNHLDPSTHKFISQCSDTTYCALPEYGTCIPRLCRRDEFPFGYAEGIDIIPPLCGTGTFCADEGDGCRPLSTFGQACQLNRDEQCASSLGSNGEIESSGVCINLGCMYANGTLGSSCLTESTTYFSRASSGEQFTYTLVRDNCQPQLYCDSQHMTCQRTKTIGYPCQSDRECDLRTCAANVCSNPPEMPVKVAAWQYAVTVTCILGAMIATCMMLTIFHKRHRFQRYKELCDYYDEQLGLRRAIIALHSAALDPGLDEKPPQHVYRYQ